MKKIRLIALTAILCGGFSCGKDNPDIPTDPTDPSGETFYTVNFDADGGTPTPEAQRVKAGDKATAPAINPAKEGYVFLYWRLSDASTAYNFQTPVTVDLTLKAQYEESTEVTTSYWDDSYRQMQLRGKVKEVKAFTEGSRYLYKYLEFDAEGNMLKAGSVYPDGYSDVIRPDIGYPYGGYIYHYDDQNRVIKAEDISSKGEVTAVVEYGYDDSHNFYLPTNYMEMMNMNIENLRLQRGVTSFNLKRRGSTIVDAKCISVSDSSLTFEATADGMLESLVGDIDKIEVDFNGDYPERLRFMEGNKVNAYSDTAVGEEGMPIKIEYKTINNQVVIDFTDVAGFLQISNAMIDSRTVQAQHNDKGYPILAETYEDGVKIMEYSYTYEYDSLGNWTTQVETFKDLEDGTAEIATTTREYTYW
jgi:hypothetical protein